MPYSRTIKRAVLPLLFAAIFACSESRAVAQLAGAPTSRKKAPLLRGSVRLQAIGSLSASHVYTSYAYIGMIGDAFAKKTMTGERSRQLLEEVARMLQINSDMLKLVGKDGLPKADVKTLQQTIEIYRLLRTQANAGVAFTRSQSPENAERFETARTGAWAAIAKLLGIRNKTNAAR